MVPATKCENCIHNKVCGLKESYEKSCAEIYTGNPNVTVEIKCDYFKQICNTRSGDVFGFRG